MSKVGVSKLDITPQFPTDAQKDFKILTNLFKNIVCQYDEEAKYMFYLNVEAAVKKDNKWLIIGRSEKEEHAGGLLSLVGGTVEKEGNSRNILERTLRRELFEELGIKRRDKMEYVRNTSFQLEDGSEVIDIVFLCELADGRIHLLKVQMKLTMYIG